MASRLRSLRPLLLLAVIGAAYFLGPGAERAPLGPREERPVAVADAGRDAVLEAFLARRSGVPVQGRGRVERVLHDDRRGSRHQRFVLMLDAGQTVIVAHNIDVARRIPELRAGDEVAFKGVYEWNDQGGVIHWTHHDPAGRHAGGWLRHEGMLYR